MTATTVPDVRTAGSWRGFSTLVATETKVWLRDFAAVFFGILFPTVILVGVGFAIPGMREPMTDIPESSAWYGQTAIASYLPTVLAMAVATAALTVMPVTFATFREKGVLRRFATTPMRPQGIIVTHLLINVVVTLVGVALALVVAALAFDIGMPQQVAIVALTFLLAMCAMFSLGMLIAAWAPKASSANAASMLLYFPMLFLAGVWTPGPIMPDVLRDIGQFTPLGAAAQAMTTGWFETGFPTLQVVVMIVWTAVLLPLAIRMFRWS